MVGVYRFLLSRQWLALAAVCVVLAATMVQLGNWQLHRYRYRAGVNADIDAASVAAPRPVEQVLRAGQPATSEQRFARVWATGRYDAAHQVLVRGRTVEGRVGFEVLTPLVLADGSALLVDRGWVAPARGAALAPGPVPAPPTGQANVTARVRLPERPVGGVQNRDGVLQARRINPAQLAAVMPYPLLGGYVTGRFDGLTPVPIEREDAWQNGGYTVQWWAFAALTVFGYAYLARRQARSNAGDRPSDEADPRQAAGPAPSGA
jgi:cytochrome oxidase assembly protein ShyY1